MDERPETGDEWMRLVNRRLTRLERRLRTSAQIGPAMGEMVFLVKGVMPPQDWEYVPDLTGEAPDGWMYVRRAQKDRPGQES